jgi:acyl-CoA thioester hydrolase
MEKHLYVDNLCHSVTADALRALFAECGNVADAHVLKTDASGFAVVIMTSESEAAKAARLDGTMFAGRPLHVSRPRRAPAAPVVVVRSANAFTHEIVVEKIHIDRFGHANNVVVLQWIQDVAEAHSSAVGFSLPDYERIGAAFVVRRHEVEYLRPSLLGERLSIRTWVPEAKRISCTRATEITSVDNGQLVARAVTTWVFADLGTARPVRIPDGIRLAFGFRASGPKMTTTPEA